MLKPFLLIDRKSGTIAAIITDSDEANEYASKKKMAVYSEDMFKIGFWIAEDPDYNRAFYNFVVENGLTSINFDKNIDRFNEALKRFDASIILIKNWNVEHYDDAVNRFVAFKDELGLTMFMLTYGGNE